MSLAELRKPHSTPPPSTAELGTQVTHGCAGSGLGQSFKRTASLRLTVPEALPSANGKSPQPRQPPLRLDMGTLTQRLPE